MKEQKNQVTRPGEKRGLNVPQSWAAYRCVLAKNHLPYLHWVPRGRYSWNVQVVIKRPISKAFFNCETLRPRWQIMSLFFTEPGESKHLSTQSLSQWGPDLAAPGIFLLPHRAGPPASPAPRLPLLILTTSLGLDTHTFCSWGTRSSIPGRLRLYFMQPLPSIFSSFNKSYFNNKNSI